jgi:hypothetical protein
MAGLGLAAGAVTTLFFSLWRPLHEKRTLEALGGRARRRHVAEHSEAAAAFCFLLSLALGVAGVAHAKRCGALDATLTALTVLSFCCSALLLPALAHVQRHRLGVKRLRRLRVGKPPGWHVFAGGLVGVLTLGVSAYSLRPR